MDRSPARRPLLVSALCFLVILADGYDTAVISFAAPSLARDWRLPAAAFTSAFVATSLGAVIGYVFCGALAARFGHRRVILWSVVSFALLCLATIFARDVGQLTACRFVTALGLGGAIPTAIALASQHARTERRELTAALVTLGIVIGSSLGGLAAVPLLRGWGWQGPFVLGAAAPLLLAAALAGWLPNAPPSPGPMRAPSPRALLRDGLAAPTLLVWLMALLSFMQSYTFTYWLPLLLTNFGFDTANAALGNTYIGAGAVAGVFGLLLMVQFVGSARYLAASFAIGVVFVLVLAFAGLADGTIPALLVVIGACLGIGGVGQASIGAVLYPVALRTTGIGWSSAMGRVGSILGPAVAGAFLGLGWPARDIIASVAAPAAVSAAAAFGIHRAMVHRAATKGEVRAHV
ncbi:MAG: MFS transporter [Acidisphaera sp.]|nr:MFS transporter [Acidisphaera sp.]MBV9813822.1 MFS transporter [Acetobacteraceae bacterium]